MKTTTVTLELGPGAALQLDAAQAERAWQTLSSLFGDVVAPHAHVTAFAGPVLDQDHAMWASASGGDGHHDEPWGPTDADLALTFYAALHGKGKQFFDVLLDHPGQLIEVGDFDRAHPGDFPNAYAVAGAINGLRKPRKVAGRRYPFHYWQTEGAATRYAIHPSVAELFHAAREALR